MSSAGAWVHGALVLALAGCAPQRGSAAREPRGGDKSAARMEVIVIHECVPGDIKLSDGQCMTPVNPGSAEIGGGSTHPGGGDGRGGGGGGGGGGGYRTCPRPPCEPPPMPRECVQVTSTSPGCINAGDWLDTCSKKKCASQCDDCMKAATAHCEECMKSPASPQSCANFIARYPNACRDATTKLSWPVCHQLPQRCEAPKPPPRRRPPREEGDDPKRRAVPD